MLWFNLINWQSQLIHQLKGILSKKKINKKNFKQGWGLGSGWSLGSVHSVHWTYWDSDICLKVDKYHYLNRSSATEHWTQISYFKQIHTWYYLHIYTYVCIYTHRVIFNFFRFFNLWQISYSMKINLIR